MRCLHTVQHHRLWHRTMQNHFFFLFTSLSVFSFKMVNMWMKRHVKARHHSDMNAIAAMNKWCVPICRVMHNVRSNISRCVAERFSVSVDAVRRCQPHNASLYIWDRSVAHVQRPYRNLETQTDIICLTVTLSPSLSLSLISYFAHTHTNPHWNVNVHRSFQPHSPETGEKAKKSNKIGTEQIYVGDSFACNTIRL